MATYLLEEKGYGVDVTVQDSTRKYTLGAKAIGDDGSKWVYGLAGEAISIYMASSIDEVGSALKLTSTNALAGMLIGFPQAAVASGVYAWFMYDTGNSNAYKVGVLSACDSDKVLMTSATAGYLDDTYTTFVPLLGAMITTTLASTGGATAIVKGPIQLGLRTSGV